MSTRRSFLKQSGLLALTTAVGLPFVSVAQLNGQSPKGKKKALRIAHITDVHIKNTPEAERGLRNLFRSINALNKRPDFILNTGDTVYEANGQTEEYVAECWDAWNRIVKEENQLEIYSTLGNHDNWYGPKDSADSYRDSPNYRKNWSIDQLKLPSRYYHFEKKGWHFIALDSINDSDYSLDNRQREWLEKTLSDINPKEPVCILSHVPILSVAALVYSMNKTTSGEEFEFPYGEMHADGALLKDIFSKHPNVKACLSGHTHYADRVNFLNVDYFNNGAASGNWWRGDLDEFPPAYAVVDLYQDGEVACNLIKYNWQSPL